MITHDRPSSPSIGGGGHDRRATFSGGDACSVTEGVVSRVEVVVSPESTRVHPR